MTPAPRSRQPSLEELRRCLALEQISADTFAQQCERFRYLDFDAALLDARRVTEADRNGK